MKTALRPSSCALRCKPTIKPQLLGRIRTCSIQAMAHRNSVEHQQRLQSMAHEFLSHWIEGCRDGATDQIMNKIAKVVDPNIVMQAAHPLGNDKVKGLEELRAMLDVGHHSNITRVDMVAVSEDNNVAFCLVECEDYALEEFAISNSQDYSKTVRKAYAIVKLDMAYDDDDPSWMTLKITGISERGQLEPADSCMLAVLEPDHRLPSYGGREREGHEALKVAGSWHFPSQHISDHVGSPLPFMKHGVDKDAAEHSIAKWCAARCSDFDEDQLMKEAVDWDNFHLWDGYGVLPTACSYNADIKDQIAKDRPSANHSCLLPTPQVLELIKASKSKNKMRCTLVDRAVCSHNNVGFSHWRTHIRPKENPDARYILEAMAVHVFNEKGKLLDIWMLRDPTPVEKQLMSAACALPEPGNKPPVYGSFRRVPRAPDGPPSIIPAARIQRV